MRALDTNVLVRVLIGDDPEQTPIAETTFVRHCHGDGVFVSLVVLAELGWVLARGYRLPRALVHQRLDQLVRTRGVVVEDVQVALDALDKYRGGTADLADHLITGVAAREGAAPLLTFDRRLAQHEQVELLEG